MIAVARNSFSPHIVNFRNIWMWMEKYNAHIPIYICICQERAFSLQVYFQEGSKILELLIFMFNWGVKYLVLNALLSEVVVWNGVFRMSTVNSLFFTLVFIERYIYIYTFFQHKESLDKPYSFVNRISRWRKFRVSFFSGDIVGF